mgnify:CR=1 FL=1
MGLQSFLVRKMLWKGLRRVLQYAGSLLAAPAVTGQLAAFGVQVDPVVTTGALLGITESGLNVLKQRFPKLLGWL